MLTFNYRLDSRFGWSCGEKHIGSDSVCLLSPFTTYRENIRRSLIPLDRNPLYLKRTPIAKQPTPYVVSHAYFNMKFLVTIFVPLTNLCDPREKPRDSKSNDTFVKTLDPDPQPISPPSSTHPS